MSGEDDRPVIHPYSHLHLPLQDILAAVDAGATAIGVATGIYTKEQLEAVAPGKDVIVLDGLHDIDGFLKAVGL